MYLDDGEIAKMQNMIKLRYVEENHDREIFYLSSKDTWRTYVGNPRKEVRRKKWDDMIDYLYRYYKGIKTTTFREVFDLSQTYRKDCLNRSINTINKDHQVYDRFITDEFGKKDIATIDDVVLNKYIQDTVKRIIPKEKALQAFITILNQVFAYAYRTKMITSDPCESVDIHNFLKECDTSGKTGDEKIFSPKDIEYIKGEIERLIMERGYDPYAHAMLFSIETGVRIGEIPPLKWSDIMDKGIHIHKQQQLIKGKGIHEYYKELPYTKNERKHPRGGRFFPMTDEIRRILGRLRNIQRMCGIESEYIFCDAEGNWIKKQSLSQRLRRFCRRLGYNITNNHAFRMSLNSNVFIPNGIPVTQRAYLLGHSVETNERFYSHMRTDMLSELEEMLNNCSVTQKRAEVTQNLIPFSQKKNRQTHII